MSRKDSSAGIDHTEKRKVQAVKKRTIILSIAALFLIGLLIGASIAVGQQKDKASAASPIKIAYMQWLQNDIVRNVEEIKRAKDPWERRDLIEDIEYIIWERIEFPLSYQEAEISDMSDLNRIGISSDVTESKEANPEAPQIAVAYALLGIAKGYEGFGAAATDYFAKAKEVYNNVMSISVNLDHSKDNRPLAEWVSASRGYWGNSSTTRVTFYGKRVSQTVVDAMNSDEINFTTEEKKSASPYTLFVAKRDFIRGMQRYIITDESLREKRANKFSIYLEPGEYRIKSSISSLYDIRLPVSRNSSQNNFIIETISNGVTLYPIPDVQIFEAEMKKALMKAAEKKEDQESSGNVSGGGQPTPTPPPDLPDLPLE
jgi:hypothetical protein